MWAGTFLNSDIEPIKVGWNYTVEQNQSGQKHLRHYTERNIAILVHTLWRSDEPVLKELQLIEVFKNLVKSDISKHSVKLMD